jgi:hypothetical protein
MARCAEVDDPCEEGEPCMLEPGELCSPECPSFSYGPGEDDPREDR